MILAGDVGGTSTRLAFFNVEGGRLKLAVEQTYPSRDHGSLDEILRVFISTHQQAADCAAFGIAGPVRRGRVETPNLSWVVEAESLERELGLKSIGLINDLEANAYGIATLAEEDFEVLNAGAPDATGNAAVISAGTGLGEAGLFWDGARHHPFACEGGHADFSPRNEIEIELLRYLLGRFGHVSWERVVSGPGLYSIYEFLRDTGRGEEPAWLAAEVRQNDPSLVVSQHGLQNAAPICVEALDLFVSLYGAEAGNLALKMMATGGIYLGGGIAPKIAGKLKDPSFMAAFVNKGRFKSLLADIPVRVILNDKTALFGAARYAALQASLIS
jgi:glucokinase